MFYLNIKKYNCYIVFLLLACFILQVKAAPLEVPVSYDDPWERVNRNIFSFNDKLDIYALKPIAKGYNAIIPKPIQGLVSNFFSNLGEIRNIINGALQLKLSAALVSLSRFAINSTVGMLGLIDVASPLGFEQKYANFGLTLAQWGVPSGAYIVIPFFGPGNIRSGIGFVPDLYTSPLTWIEPESDAWMALGVKTISIRSGLLDAEDLIMGDRYSFIRDAYLQRQEYLILGRTPIDDF
ncbi:MAG: VacJ family lipoprotein [Candidatus Endonucleobacter bathymodioli]|uniref:VacJ family lipoprotein n=1 Tax=Candidatus Endonucleibacter bathymodioli TaxID=539814 RepID=A0AA90NVH2_9GAMM|nr:VacJ family lipoprotein [Candidatus Endonucleobacter bathymodioli]